MQIVDSNSPINHPQQQSFDSLLCSSNYSNQLEDNSSLDNEPIGIGDRNTGKHSSESTRSFEIFFSQHEWESAYPNNA